MVNGIQENQNFQKYALNAIHHTGTKKEGIKMVETTQHKIMKWASKNLFHDRGYNVFSEERLKRYIPDVLAVNDDEKIGIECEMHLSRKKIWRCLKYGLKVVDRIIFVIPKDKKIHEIKKEIIMSEDKLSFIYFPFDKYPEEQGYKPKEEEKVKEKVKEKIGFRFDNINYKIFDLLSSGKKFICLNIAKKIFKTRNSRELLRYNSFISYRLKKLESYNIIKSKQRNNKIYYFLNPTSVSYGDAKISIKPTDKKRSVCFYSDKFFFWKMGDIYFGMGEKRIKKNNRKREV